MLIYYVVEKEADGLFFYTIIIFNGFCFVLFGYRMDTLLLQRLRVDHFQFSLQ